MNPVSLHALGQRARRLHIPLVPRLLEGLVFIMFHAVLPTNALIGEDSRLIHRGLGVVIHERAVIGRRVVIAPGVVIGGRSHEQVAPIIEDDVCIGAGAKILGPVRVGKGCVIGANSVVVHDVRPHCLVIGIPGHVVRENINPADYF